MARYVHTTQRFADRLAREANALVAASQGPTCKACGSTIRTTELRAAAHPMKPREGGHRALTPSYPLGTISFCPVHGLNYTLSVRTTTGWCTA